MPGNGPVRFGPGAVGKGPARHGQAPRQRPTGTGRGAALREAVEALGKGYVLTVPANFQVTLPIGKYPVRDLVGLIPAGKLAGTLLRARLQGPPLVPVGMGRHRQR